MFLGSFRGERKRPSEHHATKRRGLLALWETGIRPAGFPSSVGKLWAGSFLLFFEAVRSFSAERQRQ